jgi:heptaprenyl diphosphate synthase
MNQKKPTGRIDTKTMAVMSSLIAVAMILSFIESRIPVFIPIPGIKLGLANVATVFALYALGRKYAVCVTLIRVLLTSLLFGNFSSLIFSLLGGIFALVAMIVIKHFNLFSSIGVSVLGGIFHNIGQIIAAFIVLRTNLTLYFVPLLISGTVTGVLIGVIAGLLVERIKKYI